MKHAFLRTTLAGTLAVGLFGFSGHPQAAEPIAPIVPQKPNPSAAPTGPPAFLGMSWSEPTQGELMVTDVQAGSPFAQVGLLKGDVISAIQGKAVVSGPELDRALHSMRTGDKLAIQVLRGKSPVDLVLTVPEPVAGVDRRTALWGAFVQGDRDGQLAINTVSPDSAAAQAGLLPGDVIQALNNQPMNSPSALAVMANKLTTTLHTGDRITIRVLRNDKEHIVNLLMPESPKAATTPKADVVVTQPAAAGDEIQAGLGMTVRELTPDTVGVVAVTPNGSATRAGIQPGDILLTVGPQRVTSMATLLTSARVYKPGDQVDIEFQRGERRLRTTAVMASRTISTAEVVVTNRIAGRSDLDDVAEQIRSLQAQVSALNKSLDSLSNKVESMRR